jgi:hypothetical protein
LVQRSDHFFFCYSFFSFSISFSYFSFRPLK